MSIPYRLDPKQEMPPPGGFRVRMPQKHVQVKIPHGGYIWAGALLVMGWGWYKYAQGLRVRETREREKTDARSAVMPYLQAEADRQYVVLKQAQDREEAQLMKDVPNWKVGESVYHTKRYVPPSRFDQF